MAASPDSPERQLTGVLIGIADVPGGIRVCQLRALIPDIPGCDWHTQKQT